MDIVKTNTNVDMVRTNRLFRDARWKYLSMDGRERLEHGMYLICDNNNLPLHKGKQVVSGGFLFY
jgi:hypothetical protein